MANAPIETGTSFCLVTDHDPGALDSDYVQQWFWWNEDEGNLWWSVDLTPDNAVWAKVATGITAQGMVYLSSSGVFSGIDGSTSGYMLTSNGTGVAPSFQLGKVKAWVRFAGATGTVSEGYNVTSVTRNSTGNYTVNLSITMPSATYAVSTQSTGGGTITNYGTTTTTTAVVFANQIILGVITPVDPTTMVAVIIG